MSDHDYHPSVPKVIEAKVVVSSLVALFFSIVVALLNAVQEQPTLLAGLPPTVQFLLLAAVPPVLTFAAGYAKPSNRL